MSKSMTSWNAHCALAESSTNTEMNIHKAIHVWTINNFNYYEEIGNDLFSQIFSASTNPKVKWSIKLSLKNEYNSNIPSEKQEFIGVHLHLSDKSEEKELFAKYSFSIFNDDEEMFLSKTSPSFRKFDSKCAKWGTEYYCPKDAKFREKVLSNNVLRIHCWVIFPGKKVIPEYALVLESSIASYDSVNTWDILLKTHLLSDVMISVKTKEFPAHKAILAARSTVFAAMFQHNTKESQQNRVEIEDMSEETVAEMLRFIYTGKCSSEKLNDLATELYVAADKYDLDLLRLICLKDFLENLSVENVVRNLLLAETYKATEFKSEVIKFIVANATQVFSTEDWKKILNNPLLSQEVFRAMASQ